MDKAAKQFAPPSSQKKMLSLWIYFLGFILFDPAIPVAMLRPKLRLFPDLP